MSADNRNEKNPSQTKDVYMEHTKHTKCLFACGLLGSGKLCCADMMVVGDNNNKRRLRCRRHNRLAVGRVGVSHHFPSSPFFSFLFFFVWLCHARALPHKLKCITSHKWDVEQTNIFRYRRFFFAVLRSHRKRCASAYMKWNTANLFALCQHLCTTW